MVPLRVSSRTNLAECAPLLSSNSFIAFRLRTLELSCVSFSDSRPFLSMICGLFVQNTGGGVRTHASLSEHALFSTPTQRPLRLSVILCGLGLYLPREKCHRKKGVVTNFRINTCKSVSKRTTLTSFIINTYEKPGGGANIFRRGHMRHVTPLSPVPSFDCAYFPSPRGYMSLCGNRYATALAAP